MVKPNAYSIQTDKTAIISQHTVLVKRIAYHLLARLPASVQVDDLIQSGMIGLLEASNNFDHSKGASFETYAGIRIRGMMLDEVRRCDWVPRSVYRNARKLSELIVVLHENIHEAAAFEEQKVYLDENCSEEGLFEYIDRYEFMEYVRADKPVFKD